MSLGLHNLQLNKGSKKRKKNRVGRGNSSGHGTYSTRGLKGQKSRSGGGSGLKRMGMKMITQRIPKYKGMKSYQLIKQVVNLSVLNKNFNNGELVDKKVLFSKKLIGSMRLPFKVLGTGTLEKKLEVKAFEFSNASKVAIEKAGGKIVVVERNKAKKRKEVRKLRVQNHN